MHRSFTLALALIAAAAIAPASAAADPAGSIFINGTRNNPDRSVRVQVTGTIIEIRNTSAPPPASNTLMAFVARLADPNVTITGYNASSAVCEPGGDPGAIFCRFTKPLLPGTGSATVTLKLTDPNYAQGLRSLNATIGCLDDFVPPTTARLAADKCGGAGGKPSAVKFAETSIRGSTVSLSYRAQGATSYRCQLIGPGTTKTPVGRCGSSKTYRGLKAGSYQFKVQGVSTAGASAVATKRFTIQ